MKKFTLFLCSLFVIGSLIRIIAGNALFSTDLTYSSGRKGKVPGTKTPQDTVKSFYMLIDSGNYEKAWEICLEPDWAGDRRVTYKDPVRASDSILPGWTSSGCTSPGCRSSGWTSKEDFVNRLEQEIGRGGYGVTLHNIQVQQMEKMDRHILSSPFKIEAIEDVVSILVEGQMLGACSIFKWEKSVVVLSVEGKYKILLEGTKEPNSFFYQTWFSHIEKIGDLRSRY